MKEYKALTEDEVLAYKSMLKLPNIKFPHYEHLIVDGEIVYKYKGEKLTNEEFMVNEYFTNNYNVKLEVSNYGRIKIDGRIIEAEPEKKDDPFKHGLVFFVKGYRYPIGVHRIVKETFDPIIDMNAPKKYEVHHINNNANDNRLDNLLWVTITDHRRIDSEFKIELNKIAEIIRNNEIRPHFA